MNSVAYGNFQLRKKEEGKEKGKKDQDKAMRYKSTKGFSLIVERLEPYYYLQRCVLKSRYFNIMSLKIVVTS